MEWLTANLGTIIAALLLAVLVFFLINSSLRNRKNGGNCCGCSGCSGCHTLGMITRKGETK